MFRVALPLMIAAIALMRADAPTSTERQPSPQPSSDPLWLLPCDMPELLTLRSTFCGCDDCFERSVDVELGTPSPRYRNARGAISLTPAEAIGLRDVIAQRLADTEENPGPVLVSTSEERVSVRVQCGEQINTLELEVPQVDIRNARDPRGPFTRANALADLTNDLADNLLYATHSWRARTERSHPDAM